MRLSGAKAVRAHLGHTRDASWACDFISLLGNLYVLSESVHFSYAKRRAHVT
jgi:hypothetical protein